MITSLITLFIAGIVGLVMLTVVLALVGTVLGLAFGLAGFVLFKVLPVLLVGWVVLKVIEHTSGGRRKISTADQRWLDGA